MTPALPSATSATRIAARACAEVIAKVVDDCPASSPAHAFQCVAAALSGRDSAWVVRSDPAANDPAGALASAWPLRFLGQGQHEKPLFYALTTDSVDTLRALATETGERGIYCNDAEGHRSCWPKSVAPAVPLWLAGNHRCTPYDPASGVEVQAIMLATLERLYVKGEGGFVYMSAHHRVSGRQVPLSADMAEDAARGMYLLMPAPADDRPKVRLLGAGCALDTVIDAAHLLDDWGVAAEVWSCPSYTRLARDAQAAERWNSLHPLERRRRSHLHECLGRHSTPVIAVTGYPHHVAGQIGAYAPGFFTALGVEAAGLSQAAGAGIDACWIVVVALKALADEGQVPIARVKDALGHCPATGRVQPSARG